MRVDPETHCLLCEKHQALCVCDEIRPLASRIHLLILQHPQEPDEELGSARVLSRALPRSTLRVGLSWPNLKAALGSDAGFAPDRIQPARWAVLYLGSGIKATESDKAGTPARGATSRIVFLDRKGSISPDQHPPLDGLVLLDGTWAQAKTLWWRNAWLLKLRRAVLLPAAPSQYGELRREPRRECLSTIESAAAALDALGEPGETGEALRALFGRMLDKARAQRTRARRPAPPMQ